MAAEDYKPFQDQTQTKDEGVTGANPLTPTPDTPSPVTSAYEGYDGAPSDIESGRADADTDADTDITETQNSEDQDNEDLDDINAGDVDLDDEDEGLTDDTVRQDGGLG